MRAVVTLLFAASVASIARSQPTEPPPADPVVASFREYRAALERNDLPAAETAAEAALAASQASDGRRTAVLALNLANLRLELGGDYDALAPAQTAYALAVSPDAGIDALAAALTLGQAEIRTGDAVAGAQRLLDAFTAAQAAGTLEPEVYAAAVMLGLWGIADQRYLVAHEAWTTAERLARVAEDPTLARARALTGQGAAILLASTDRRLPALALAELTAANAQTANDKFTVAQRLLMPAALGDNAAAEVTPSQRAFAEALAWHSALLAKVQSQGAALPTTTPYSDDAPRFDRPGVCVLRAIIDPAPPPPGDALDRYSVGAVVVHMRLDARGRVVGHEVVASVPSRLLEGPVRVVAEKWRVEKEPGTARDCRMPSSHFVPTSFILQ
jgi:hypothetical protein